MPPPVAPPVRFTVDEYDRMIEQGVIEEGSRCELIQGLIVAKAPKTPHHEYAANKTFEFLFRLKIIDELQRDATGDGQERCRVRKEAPLRLPDQASAPEPDVMLLRGSRETFIPRHPVAADVLLLVEVADSSLAKDQRMAAIYAAAGVARYLLVDLTSETMTLHERPTADGYESVAQIDRVPIAIGGDAIGELTAETVFPAS